jgi:hypothetical protein
MQKSIYHDTYPFLIKSISKVGIIKFLNLAKIIDKAAWWSLKSYLRVRAKNFPQNKE